MGLRVFLVDDLLSMHSLMRDLFAAVGGVELVATASSEGEARLWVEDHAGEWDVAVLDLVLQQGSGMGVIGPCREHHPSGQVAIFSGYVTPVIRQHCLRLGADAVFGKDETAQFVTWLHGLAHPGPASTGPAAD
jgi:DNA-binding NarL/FixJ family response regulator